MPILLSFPIFVSKRFEVVIVREYIYTAYMITVQIKRFALIEHLNSQLILARGI